MNQLELIKAIEKRKNELEEEKKLVTTEVKFCEEFSEIYHGNSLNILAEMNMCDLFLTIYSSKNKKISFEELYDFVSKNEKFIKYVNDSETIMDIFAEMKVLMDTGKYDTIQSFFKEDSESKSIETLLTLEYFSYMLFEKAMERLIGLEDGYDIYSLMEMYKKDGIEIFMAKAAVSVISEFKKLLEQNDIALSLAEQAANKKLDKKRANKIRKMFLSGYNIEAIQEYITDSTKYVTSVLSNEKKRQKALTKEIALYDKLENDLFRLMSSGEVTQVEKLIEKVPDDNIRLNALALIYKHNNEIYAKLQEEYNDLSSPLSSQYQVLLANHGISAEQYDVSTIMDSSLEELSEILEKLKKIGITGPKISLSIIQNSDLETVSYLETLLDKNIISKEFLIKNQNVFFNVSAELLSLKTNIDYLSEKGLNVHYLRASQDMFLLEPERLEESLKTLEDYDLIGLMKTGVNCTFLRQENLKESIDTLLELGYEKNLEESLEVLNYSDKFERLRMLKELNVPVTTTEELLSVLSQDKFLIPDEDITSYIYNAVNYLTPNVERITKINPDLEAFAEYSETSRTYSFDGVLISKNKVKRNLSTVSLATNEFDRLVFGVVYGSSLSDEEFAKIDKLIRKDSPKTMKKTIISE